MTTDKVEEIVENLNHHLYNGYDTFAKKHLRQALTQYHQDLISEVVEIIESVHLTATKKHADDTTPEKARIVNEWLMPEVKRNIIEAVKAPTIIKSK